MYVNAVKSLMIVNFWVLTLRSFVGGFRLSHEHSASIFMVNIHTSRDSPGSLSKLKGGWSQYPRRGGEVRGPNPDQLENNKTGP